MKSNSLFFFIFFLLLTILSLKNDKFEYADNFTLILMKKKIATNSDITHILFQMM